MSTNDPSTNAAGTASFQNGSVEIPFIHQVLDTHTWPGAVTLAVVFLVIAWLIGRALKVAVHRYLDRAQNEGADPTGIRFLGQLANIFVYVFAFLIYSHAVPALNKVGTAWLTSMGVVSVVLGLAAQGTLGNLISGISLVLYRPFKIGDRLEISGPKGVETGTVENINLGTTVVRTAENRLLVIPNNTMVTQIAINVSGMRKGATCSFSVTLANTEDVERARQILTDLAKARDRSITVDGCPVTAFSSSGITMTLNAWCADPNAASTLKSELMENAKRQLDAAGIKIV